MSNSYKFGLVCISLDVQNQGFRFQTMTRKRFNELAVNVGGGVAVGILAAKIRNNLKVTAETIRHCGRSGIAAYRLSSDLFPLVTDPTLDLSQVAQSKTVLEEMDMVKRAVEETGVRISLHPDQWNVLPSLNSITVDQTIKQLNFFGWMMDAFGCERSHWNPINIHVGLSGKELEGLKEIHDRFVSNFEKLDDGVKARLTIECDDKGLWTTENLFKHFGGRFPLCYDEHHDAVNPCATLSANDAFHICLGTWVMRAHPEMPLFHYSESILGDKNIRAHADYATRLPRQTGLLPTEQIYWDCELKCKDKAIYKLMEMAAEQESKV